jgi:hypothetical protein
MRYPDLTPEEYDSRIEIDPEDDEWSDDPIDEENPEGEEGDI